MTANPPPPPDFVVFKVPRQLLADLLFAEREMLLTKTNRTRGEFINLARALLTSMENAAAVDRARE